MRKIRNIPLIRASVVEPFILAARAIGTPVEKLLESAGLPGVMLDDFELLVPEIPAWKLAQAIARIEDAPLFGLQATFILAHQDIRTVRPLIEGCINLKGLLERFCLIVPTQTNTGQYIIEEDGEFVWLRQTGPRLLPDRVQVELFEVAGMMQLVQLVAGEKWRPPEIHFSFKHCDHVINAELLNPSKIKFSQRYPAIVIPRGILMLEVPDLGTSKDLGISLPPVTLKDQLLYALPSYLGAQKLTETVLSDITGMSFRTLQRTLDNQCTSYSRILDQVRFQKAQSLLKETDEKLLNISMMLGYENASAFSRAFKRWSGVSPREFRTINVQIGHRI